MCVQPHQQSRVEHRQGTSTARTPSARCQGYHKDPDEQLQVAITDGIEYYSLFPIQRHERVVKEQFYV